MTDEYAKGKEGLGIRCCKNVRTDGLGFPRYHQCRCWARIERDTGKYCKQHDPLVAAQKAKARKDKFAEKRAARRAAHERRRLEAAYCKDLTNDDLRKGIGE